MEAPRKPRPLKPIPSSPGQREADFFGGLIDHVPLSNCGGVAGETLRNVLRAVYELPEQFGGQKGQTCWAGQDRIADAAGIEVRQLRDAMRVLVRIGLVICYRAQEPGARSRKTLNHYLVVWTELGALRDGRSCAVAKPSPTKAMPVTRPVHGHGVCGGIVHSVPVDRSPVPVDRSPVPVDRSPVPVDRSPVPVDRSPVPVDRRDTAFLSYGVRQERIYTTATAYPESREGSGRDQADGPDRTDWGAVAAVLAKADVRTAHKRVNEMVAAGWSASGALVEVQRLAGIAAKQPPGTFEKGIGAGLAYRLQYGDWPCVVNEDLAAVESRGQANREAAEEGRWRQAWTAAYREVRAATPPGITVDDHQVVEAAARRGVPREWAARESGVVCDG